MGKHYSIHRLQKERRINSHLMSTSTLVSIIIPTYKDRGGLKAAIYSAIGQTYKSIEIIVIDDNGDNSIERTKTEALMEEFANFSNIRYIKHRWNLNGAAARNTGIEQSKGEIIAFLDDDDLFLPEKVEKQVKLLREKKFDALYCGAYLQGKKSKCSFEGSLSKELLLLQAKLFTPSLVFYKRTLLEIGCFDETYNRHQDYELLLKFFKAGFTMGCLNECLVIIGSNRGENTIAGRALEQLKDKFFLDFQDVIFDLNRADRNFRRKMYAIHYSHVFLSYIKSWDLQNAFRVFRLYLLKAPATAFYSVILRIVNSFSIKLKRIRGGRIKSGSFNILHESK